MPVQVSQNYYDQLTAQVQAEQSYLANLAAQKIEHERYLADYQAVLADLEPVVFGS